MHNDWQYLKQTRKRRHESFRAADSPTLGWIRNRVSCCLVLV